MLTRPEKEKIIDGLKADIDQAQAVFLTNLIGIPSNDAVRLRKSVRDAKGKIVVTKNTFFERAGAGTPCEELVKGLKGPNALAFAYEDAAAVAKSLYDFGKELEIVELRGAVLEGKSLEPAQVVELAKLPSRDQMLATLLATFNAPVSAFVRVMNSIKEKKEEGGEAVAAEAAPAEAAPAEEAPAEAAPATEESAEKKEE